MEPVRICSLGWETGWDSMLLLFVPKGSSIKYHWFSEGSCSAAASRFEQGLPWSHFAVWRQVTCHCREVNLEPFSFTSLPRNDIWHATTRTVPASSPRELLFLKGLCCNESYLFSSFFSLILRQLCGVLRTPFRCPKPWSLQQVKTRLINLLSWQTLGPNFPHEPDICGSEGLPILEANGISARPSTQSLVTSLSHPLNPTVPFAPVFHVSW